MNTVYLHVNHSDPEPDLIETAAAFLAQGELVVFPTETVYGVGALAFSEQAASKIFIAKGRPAQTPLLVHVSSLEQALGLAAEFPEPALTLARRYWPGPLSLVLPAREWIPKVVRGGTSTVGLRMPSHPVAMALIDITGPLAATSANISGRPSPLTADHVRSDLDGRVRAVLDAGATGYGLESTVLDLSGPVYRVLRQGAVAIEEIENTIGSKIELEAQAGQKHYQIGIPIRVCFEEEVFLKTLHKMVDSGERVGIVYNDIKPRPEIKAGSLSIIEYDLKFQEGSMGLYAILRDAESQGLKALIFCPLPDKAGGIEASILDRIKSAAASSPSL